MAGGPSITNPNINNRPVGRSGDIAQTGGVKGSQSVQKAAELTTDQQAAQKVQAPQIETFSRKMSTRDIINQLLQIGVRATAENRDLAMKMLVMGLELSRENFGKMEKLLQGLDRNTFTQQAAIIAISKGLDSKTAVQQLASFLEANPQMSEQLANLMSQSTNIQAMLANQSVISPALSGQLASIMSSLESSIAVLPDTLRKDLKEGRGLLQKSGLLTNMRAVKALLQGVVKQAEANQKPDTQGVLQALKGLANQAKDVAENLIVQAILSRPNDREDSALTEKFSYWQIPNSMATPPQTFELLVLRDRKDKYKTINKKNTKVILKTSTPELGEIAIEVDVKDDQLDLKFNTKEDEIRVLINQQVHSLIEKLSSQNYKTKTIRVIKRDLDVKKYLIPTLDLNNLTRVQSEA